MTQILTKITVEGVDVTSHLINYTVADTFEDITPAKITFVTDVLSSLNLEAEQTVVITRGTTTSTDYTIFKGVISSVNKKSSINIVVNCFDQLWKLQRIVLNKTYDKNIDTEAGVISAIAQDLIETYGGLTADVEASGSVNTIDQFILRNNNLLEKLKELAGLIGYMVYYDPDTDKVVFKTRGFTTFGTTLQTGVNLVEIPEWKYDYTKIINDVTVVGGLQEVETTDTSNTGDGATTKYTLDFKPESVKVFVNSVLKIGGISGQSNSFDYSVDKENLQINFETAPTAGHSIEIRYSYLVPIKMRQKDPTSISKYGQYQIEIKIDTILTTDDAFIKSTEILTKFKDPQVKSRLRTYNVLGIKAGYQVPVIDTENDENRTVLIRRINYNYPVHIDEIMVDNIPLYEDYYLKNEIVRRLRQLEKKNQSDNDFITSILSMSRTIKYKRRYFKLVKDVVDMSNSWIVGHYNGSIVGSNKVGGTFTSENTLQKIIPGEMVHKEFIYDNDFTEVGTTATVDTTNRKITF